MKMFEKMEKSDVVRKETKRPGKQVKEEECLSTKSEVNDQGNVEDVEDVSKSKSMSSINNAVGCKLSVQKSNVISGQEMKVNQSDTEPPKCKVDISELKVASEEPAVTNTKTMRSQLKVTENKVTEDSSVGKKKSLKKVNATKSLRKSLHDGSEATKKASPKKQLPCKQEIDNTDTDDDRRCSDDLINLQRTIVIRKNEIGLKSTNDENEVECSEQAKLVDDGKKLADNKSTDTDTAANSVSACHSLLLCILLCCLLAYFSYAFIEMNKR